MIDSQTLSCERDLVQGCWHMERPIEERNLLACDLRSRRHVVRRLAVRLNRLLQEPEQASRIRKKPMRTIHFCLAVLQGVPVPALFIDCRKQRGVSWQRCHAFVRRAVSSRMMASTPAARCAE